MEYPYSRRIAQGPRQVITEQCKFHQFLSHLQPAVYKVLSLLVLLITSLAFAAAVSSSSSSSSASASSLYDTLRFGSMQNNKQHNLTRTFIIQSKQKFCEFVHMLIYWIGRLGLHLYWLGSQSYVENRAQNRQKLREISAKALRRI